MRYLNVIHVPFLRASRADHVMADDLWLTDIRAHVRALGNSARLVICSPLLDQAQRKDLNYVEVKPTDEGFDYAPLTPYISMKEYLQRRRTVYRELEQAVATSDVLHTGLAGHPVPMGHTAWTIAGKLRKPRIYIFDGADPFHRIYGTANSFRNPIRRAAKLWHARRLEAFSRNAVREADLVFAHNDAVIERFKDVWDESKCYRFDRTFVTDDMLTWTARKDERERYMRDTSQPLRMVVAGRQVKIKATDHVLRAMKQAIAAGADVRLDIYGEGDDLPAFKNLASELRLVDAVRFHGQVPYGESFFRQLQEAHVMVITNLTAEISRNVMIAMALGLPLIIYRNPGTDRLIEQSNAGILVPQGDEAALANAFVEAHRDRARLWKIIENGLVAARGNTLDGCHQRRVQIFRERILSKSERPAMARGSASSSSLQPSGT